MAKTISWVKRAPLRIARSHPATTVLKDKIYLFGGGGLSFKSLNTVEIYDPKTNQWTFGSEMPTHRSGAAAVALNDKIYVMGGGFKKPDGKFQFYKIVEIYDPESNSWERGPDLLQPHDYPAFALFNNEIYIIGGHHPDATEGGPQTDPGFAFCEKLNPLQGTWKEISPLNIPRFALAAGVLNQKIVAFGGVACAKNGFSEYDAIETYNPETNCWENDENFVLPWPAAAHGGMTFNNAIYLFGGYSTEGIHTRAAFYQPNRKKWEQLPELDEPRAAVTPVGIQNEIFLAGGWAKDGRTPLQTVSSYKLS